MMQVVKKVEINWIDSKSGPCEWEHWDDLEPLEPVKCTTIGYLVEDNEDYKVIASTISDKFLLGRIAIPAVCVLKIKVIK